MIGYTMMGTNDLDRARRFYDALFETVGARPLMELAGGGCLYGASWNRPLFGLGRPYNGEPATVGNGTMVGLAVDDAEQVRRLHAKALELGGSDEGAPGPRGPEGDQSFYGAYFRDLDGNKLSAFYFGAG